MPDKPGRIRWMAADFRTWPRRAKIAVLAILAVELAAPVVIWLAQPDLPHTDPADLPGEDIAVPADLAAPSAPEEEGPQGDQWEIPEYEGDPRQTFEVQSHFYSDLLETDHGLLVAGTSSVALEADGEIVWEIDPETDLGDVHLLGQIVVATEDLDDPAWSGRKLLTAYSARTGEPVWSDDEVDYTTAVDGGLYLTRCGLDEDDDSCTVTARDKADGAVLWTLDGISGARFDLGEDGFRPSESDYLLLETEPKEDEYELALVNRWNGEVTAPRIAEGDADIEVAVYDGRVTSWTEYDEDPTDGCRSDIAGYAIGASEPGWTMTVETDISDDLADCRNQPMRTPNEGHLAVTLDGHPVLIDTATGETAWKGETEAFAYGAGDTTLVALQDEALVGIDMDTGEERWSTEWRGGRVETRVVGTTMWTRNCGDTDLCAVNLETGEVVRLPGGFAYMTEDTVVTSKKVEGESTGAIHIWPLDLWA